MRRGFFQLSVVAAVVVVVWSATRLPDRVAIHFGTNGSADRWVSRTEAIVTSGVLVLGLALLFWGLGRWLPKLPMSMVNLPQASKQAWIEAGQEDLLRRSMADDLYAIGGMTMLLIAGAEALTVVANRQESPALGWEAIVLVGVYLAAVTIWTVRMLTKYRRPPAESG